MRQPAKPTHGFLSTKIETRRDALDVADSIIPVADSDLTLSLATRSVLSEAIWSLQVTRPNTWRLSDLRKVTGTIDALRNILANTNEGRSVSEHLLPTDAPGFCAEIVETISLCLH